MEDLAIGRLADGGGTRREQPCLQSHQEAAMEMFWTVVAIAVILGLGAAALALLALLWHASGRRRTA